MRPSLDSMLREDSKPVISCDVFDTLLRRNMVSESNRIRLIAKRASTMLMKEYSLAVDPEAIARARAAAQYHAYRALDMLHPHGEVKFVRMVEATAVQLGLSADHWGTLSRAEIEVEITQLTANRGLISRLSQRATQGARIIAVSDTWHNSATIQMLLDSVAPGHPVHKVYTSADLDATKRSGAIFAKVLAAERRGADEVLHIGDNETADYRMPTIAGLSATLIAIPPLIAVGRKIDGFCARALHPTSQN